MSNVIEREEQTQKCPECWEDIKIGAKKCKHCGADLSEGYYDWGKSVWIVFFYYTVYYNRQKWYKQGFR